MGHDPVRVSRATGVPPFPTGSAIEGAENAGARIHLGTAPPAAAALHHRVIEPFLGRGSRDCNARGAVPQAHSPPGRATVGGSVETPAHLFPLGRVASP